ncbi:unnamed protein product [Spirodela intermedia]|uniref:SPARK domain-containing protein n=1 Tax=Spirodela intermedia TaxID=51605 RepID=A0A7I8KBS7_SPIIN|nr:unnamed protein product [Spirodela intermedia]
MEPFKRSLLLLHHRHRHLRLLLLLLLLILIFIAAAADGDPLAINTVPAVPQAQSLGNRTCKLDLSPELFGGVAGACGGALDRRRCCPVLAAWLFAAHAGAAFEARPPSSFSGPGEPDSDLPMIPDDSQRCVDSLQNSLRSRNIHLAGPNATCDAVLCFCGIRLHQIGSLSCPAAFNSSPAAARRRRAVPTAAVRDLEKNCRNSSYAGCTRCLESLDKLKSRAAGGGGRQGRMFSTDCQLMALTWLLARNRTTYIATVSAALRAIMYSSHTAAPYRCSSDQENMPLAVDSLRFDRHDGSLAGGVAATAAVFRAGPYGCAAALLSSFLLSLSVLT